MLSAMSNGKASSRRMIYILFAGMIIALSINLSSAITCAKSFQPGVLGNVPPGKALCDTGLHTHTCEFNHCYVVSPSHPVSDRAAIAFRSCRRVDGSESGPVGTVYVASFVTSDPPKMLITNGSESPKGTLLQQYYCPMDQVRLPSCNCA
ncbi:hypothetical protein PGTUg99_003853 [Puccinia graminis f. sp. tritici]|uniref:Uncharacterized protein n=1 Tax=Puccinia graminis f. sp. tritici TaxID=56615 RepID=A0A5B0QE60_PUCGR|nr:hypothetical protein PGTUg99_003853 [Puccinia graminis f. sp. tritici]